MWDTFAVFNMINKNSRHEPDRYHIAETHKILGFLDFDSVWESYKEKELAKRKKSNGSPQKKVNFGESGIFDRNDHDPDDDIFDILNTPKAKEEVKTPTKKSPKKLNNKDSAEFIVGRKDYNEIVDKNASETTVKVKHIFEINVKEVRNVPILKKILKDINRGDKSSEGKDANKYIQDVFVKYIFPLDDEQITSDYLEYSPSKDDCMDYKVSMHSYHTYLLETDKPVASSLGK
jgi:hypothetical protein